MRGKSHQHLGRQLADTYLSAHPRRYIKAFLFGCIQPDRNPATYLKGSLRQQWLRGHNWGNAQNYMSRIARRLENRQRLRLLDYYTLGKLIHYTMDAFTSAHNAHFGTALTDHRQYEVRLQQYFLQYPAPVPAVQAAGSMMDTIRHYHQTYEQLPIDIHTDTAYAVLVCHTLFARLFSL